MNRAILMGRLTADPIINDRITCASFTLAVDRKYSQDVDFIPCKLLGEKRADFANKYLRKGMKIIISGSIQTGNYINKDSQKIYTTDVIVDTTEFAESKSESRLHTQPSVDENGWMNISDGINSDLPFD